MSKIFEKHIEEIQKQGEFQLSPDSALVLPKKDGSLDYPLGGSLEPYDIWREQQM